MELLDFAKTNTAARLRAAASRGALSHALIFSGNGDRVSAARYAAAAMECTGAQKPCLACPACRKVMQDIHPDVTFVRDAEHKELSVDTVRAMRADAFIRPNEGARKIYIFEDCTILTEKDQNVLLKLVEEGPSYAAFFFCAENPAVLLQTIRSRCVEVKLSPVLQEDDAPDERALELARRIAEGTRASRAAFLAKLETQKLSRDDLSALFERTRLLLADALLAEQDGDMARLFEACRGGLQAVESHAATMAAFELRVSAFGLADELAETAVRAALRIGDPRLVLRWSERARASALFCWRRSSAR